MIFSKKKIKNLFKSLPRRFLTKLKIRYKVYGYIEFFYCLIFKSKDYTILTSNSQKKVPKNNLIVILAYKVSDRTLLLGRLWYNRGYSVFLIYCKDNPIFENKEVGKFNAVLKANNALEAVRFVLKLNPKFVHYTCYSADLIGYHLLKHGIKFILDYKDLFYKTYSSFNDKESGMLERELVSKSEYITCRDKQIHNYINLNNLEINRIKLLKVPEFFISNKKYESLLKFKKENKKINFNEIKLVMSGGFTEDSNKNRVLREGVSKVLEILIENQIQVDILGGFSNIENKQDTIYIENLKNKHVGVRFLPALNSDQYDLALLDYDFALHMVNNDLFTSDYSIHFDNTNHMEFSGSARVLSFIKAGIPILTGKTYAYTNEFLENSGLSVPIDQSKKYIILDILKNYIISMRNGSVIIDRDKYSERRAWENFGVEIKKIGG